ncbi:EscI/YscI/HrpB family type III secretion system inner rod protein [Pigmentiphaga aceris]|uniref:EscI/YscI/HrpB family type III secretion system inner rod protein n=1 Tax=Pigmentiphaga aceris TaxID=1940612 RepID=A0A5C0B1V6_9BURK|nr:type III secretion system inner rod subunit SctI [Pigmentiphaga aceris]QEI08265.1 EscI/YscI/HrpB family type III secretion system inner rod protein [Pigmentiphaga aceris]
MDIAAVALAQLAPGLSGTAATPAVAPTTLATERFNAIMNAPDMSTITGPLPTSATIVQAPVTPLTDAGSPTLGNQILSGLRTTASDFSQKWQNIAVGLDKTVTQPNIADMLRLQSELVQVSVQYELVGKAVSRTTQNIDAMVKMS